MRVNVYFRYKILSNDIEIIKHVFTYQSLVCNNCTAKKRNLVKLHVCINFVDKILLFVTGRENIKGNPLEIIRDEIEALQNRVVIHTFGVGIGESFITDLISTLKCNSQKVQSNLQSTWHNDVRAKVRLVLYITTCYFQKMFFIANDDYCHIFFKLTCLNQ